jgi:hypothetical protein
MSKEAINSVRRVLDIHRDTRVAMPKDYLGIAYRNLSVAEDRIAELEAENARLLGVLREIDNACGNVHDGSIGVTDGMTAVNTALAKLAENGITPKDHG